MRVAIVGSGHAAVSAAKALVRRGVKPVILDAGETLDGEAAGVRDRLRARQPEDWDAADVDRAIWNDVRGSARIPKKRVYGSDFLFAHDRPTLPTENLGTDAAQTLARGGFSIAWGGCMLPASESDIGDWPADTTSLEPHYRAVLEHIPLSGSNDALAAFFPLFKDDPQPIHLDKQARGLLEDLDRAGFAAADRPNRIVYGQAREAVWARGRDGGSACIYCGICLSGCPYGALYSADHGLDRLVREGQVEYRDGILVRSVREADDRVSILWQPMAGGPCEEESFSRIFIGAGGIGSTRIALESARLFDVPVVLKDSTKFAVPFLRFRSAPVRWPNVNTLAGVFIEAMFEDISSRWLHVQVSSANELVLQKLRALDGRGLNRWGRMLGPVLGRLMVAFCGLHSDHSHELELRLRPDATRPCPTLSIARRDVNDTKAIAERLARRMARIGLRFRSLVLSNIVRISEPGSTGCAGGAFPMRRSPRRQFEADVLGRPYGWNRVHLIDASVFPSIPGTTVALLIMANAHRIATDAELD